MFYDNFVRLCNSIEKSPSAVALEIGIAKPTVSRWKSGSKPNHATLLKVADYFGVAVSDLTKEEKIKKPATTDGSGLSAETMELIRLYDLASPELQAAALAVLKAAEAADKVQSAETKEK